MTRALMVFLTGAMSLSCASSMPTADGSNDGSASASKDAANDPSANSDPVLTACETLLSTYRLAVHAAQSCNHQAAMQCLKTVPGLSIGCGIMCETAVNDDSTLTPLVSRWQELGCGSIPGHACVAGCRSATPGRCVEQPGGSSVCDP